MMIGAASQNKNPFTAAQWEEFEHQALIYKYMLSGVPVPPQLLRTLHYSPSNLLFPPQPTLGRWGENEIVSAANANAGGMSYGWGGRRIDPEPGRCRRTDGKKWRCSKEAHPESRYCERHMHRGRNRTNNSCSRKPVEFQFSSVPTTTPTLPPPPATATTSSIIPPSISHDYYKNTLVYPSLRHLHLTSSSSSRPSPSSTQHHFLDPAMPFSHQHKDHRYLQGETERAFPRDPYTTLRMNQSHPFDFYCLLGKSKHEQSEQHEEQGLQHCYVLGTDIKPATPRSSSITGLEERGGDQENQDKPFHHFFSDWPQHSSEDSTTCIDDIVGSQSTSTTTATQLSISMPLSTQDFFQSKPTAYW